jgi:Uncharacterised conserved protein
MESIIAWLIIVMLAFVHVPSVFSLLVLCRSTSLLPLPIEVSNMFSTSQKDHQDDPALHGGRIRSFAHERGNWASLVYIPC